MPGPFRGNRFERAPRFFVAEGVQQCDRAREFGIDIAARRREVNDAERLGVSPCACSVFLRRDCRGDQQGGRESERK